MDEDQDLINPVNEFGNALVTRAQRHGFSLAGVCDLDAVMPYMSEHVAWYEDWIAAQHHGEMDYLRRGLARRADPRALWPQARGVLCVAMAYGPDDDGVPRNDARYARYLRGRDYHKVVPEKLTGVLGEVAGEFDFEWKICCDTSAVLERSLAHLAGLGWIGKNACLIHPRLGSYLFLAEAFLSRSPGGSPAPIPDHCGSCERCLVACPTAAFVAPHVLDARRCLSYWTLEKRGALELEPSDANAVGGWVAGCDICQDVCPFNRKPRPEIDDAWRDADADATSHTSWEELVAESEERYVERVRQSALSWVRPPHFRRNVALGLASRVDSLTSSRRENLAILVEVRMSVEIDGGAKSAWAHCLRRLRSL